MIISPERDRRFWAKVDKEGPIGVHSQTGELLGNCWVWTGAISQGYGMFGIRSGWARAAREAGEATVKQPCPMPLLTRFLAHEGAVEQLRRDKQEHSHLIVKCECGGWHVVPRNAVEGGAA